MQFRKKINFEQPYSPSPRDPVMARFPQGFLFKITMKTPSHGIIYTYMSTNTLYTPDRRMYPFRQGFFSRNKNTGA